MTRARFRYRARPSWGPFRINIARGRGVLPRVSSVAVKLGPLTWNPTRRTTSIDTPGIGSVMIPYGGRARGAVTTRGGRLAEPELDAWAVEHVTCPRDTCRAVPGSRCHRPGGQPCDVHMQRRELARTERHYGPSTTPGGRTTTPGPIRPLGRLLSRVLGLVAVVALAWLSVLLLGAGSALDVFAREIGR